MTGHITTNPYTDDDIRTINEALAARNIPTLTGYNGRTLREWVSDVSRAAYLAKLPVLDLTHSETDYSDTVILGDDEDDNGDDSEETVPQEYTAWAVTKIGHPGLRDYSPDCADCLNLANDAIATARVTGSVGSSYENGDHSISVSRVHQVITIRQGDNHRTVFTPNQIGG